MVQIGLLDRDRALLCGVVVVVVAVLDVDVAHDAKGEGVHLVHPAVDPKSDAVAIKDLVVAHQEGVPREREAGVIAGVEAELRGAEVEVEATMEAEAEDALEVIVAREAAIATAKSGVEVQVEAIPGAGQVIGGRVIEADRMIEA
mmetsp:Transcript_9110/g.10125  ORF Transcript_9110/g.10125 Transcript_9110/m.10125 type:complete len:145 (+) Transcript_9110:600-1034(+)